MKYLKNRQEFLYKEIQIESINVSEQIKSSEMINEAFENDITWGGSLLGRLINSTIRKGKIYFQTMRIGSVVNQVRSELDNLVGIAAADEEQLKQVYSLQVRFLLTEIYKVVISKDSLDKKLTALVGDKSEKSGLIAQTIIELEKLTNEQLENREELIEKLKRFREALLKIDFTPEDSSGDENEEGEGSEEESQGDKEPNKVFYLQTFNLLKSIIDINRVVVEKRVVVNKIEVGKEYLDKNNKVCKVVSIDFEDETKTKKLPEGIVSVIYRDEQKIFSNSTRVKVKKLELKPYTKGDTVKGKTPKQTKPGQSPSSPGAGSGSTEKKPTMNPNSGESQESKKKLESFYYENESLPIYEEATEIKDNEVHARAAWNKISSAWMKCGITKLVPRIEELVNKARKGDEQTKKDIKLIAKQLMANKATVGSKPLTFEELIKEALDTQINNDIPKAIAVVSRYLLAFNEDLGLLASIGDANKPIKSFIDSFKKIEEAFPKIKKEEPKKESYKVYNYSKFRILEADDIEMEEEDSEEDNKETEDKVREEWNKEFKEGEEKEWKVNEPDAKKLQKDLDEKSEKGIQLDAESFKDNIIRIVNLFGKAYKMYAVPSIPSGRPNGRVSQKTFREYTYLGGDETPGYSAEQGSQKGPWAANLPFEKWQNGIMKILEDTKYRKVLANTKFKNRGPNQKEGSGLTLFNFINDMLGESGKGGSFRTKRHEILKKYFEGVIDEKETDSVSEGEGKIKKEDYGKSGDLSFQLFSILGRTYPINIKKHYSDDADYNREFFKIEYFDGTSTRYLTGFVMGILKGTKSKGLVLKFHKSGKKESILTSYLKDKGYKLPTEYTNDKNQSIFVGVININDKLNQKQEITMKAAEITGQNTWDKVEDFNVNLRNVYSLCNFNTEKGKWQPIKMEEAPKERPTKDITDITSKIGPKKAEFGIE